MKVIEISGPGGPEVLTEATNPRPAPADGEVLIRVRAAGVNGHDLHHRARGSHPVKPGETQLPGLEVAGEIAAVGGGVNKWKTGDKVCTLLRGGGYAEYAVAPEGQCLPVPKGYSWIEAAALPEAAFTVWSNVFEEAGLQPGESFLMNGGTSGIGVTAIQMISALGHTVFATAGGPEKCKTVKDLGATRAIDYQTEEFDQVINDETDGKGVDVILDIVGGDYLQKDFACMARGGRLVIIGAAKGLEEKLDLRPVVMKNLTLAGTLLRPRSNEYKKRVADALLEKAWPLYDSRRIFPVIDSVFPLNKAADAHRKMESRQHVGKVMLEVS